MIEDADLGAGIAQDLGGRPSACKPSLDQAEDREVARMQARSVMFETGSVFLPLGDLAVDLPR